MAGNLTYDGICRYGYDDWSRMDKVTKAYRDTSGMLRIESMIDILCCDGGNRRIKNRI